MNSICAVLVSWAVSVGNEGLEGGTIVTVEPPGNAPSLIYRIYPANAPVQPSVPWQLSFGVKLPIAASSIDVSLQLDPAQANPSVQILRDTATFVRLDNLYHNDDPGQRFELNYIGVADPFVGAIDFLIQPEGMPSIPVRVNVGVIEQVGFPAASTGSSTNSVPVIGDITGDGMLEIVTPGSFLNPGLHAIDHSGMPLPGWPFVVTGPDVLEQSFGSAAIADLDGDSVAEVVVVGAVRRNVAQSRAATGTITTVSLYAIEGSGAVRWSITDNFQGTPAIGDINIDGEVDIVVGGNGNLRRVDKNGMLNLNWSVQAQSSLSVTVPVLADIDGDPANGLEIVSCTFITAPPFGAQIDVWNQDGSVHGPAWPKAVERCQPPTVIDFDMNPANGLEIVNGLDHFDNPPVDPNTGFINTFSIFAWHGDGSDAIGWPHHFMRPPPGFVDDRVLAPFAGGDIDGDGDPEIVVGVYGQGDPTAGNLFVFHHDGALDGNWPRWAGIAQSPSLAGGPALGDIDGDGRLEIVTGSFLGTYVFDHGGESFPGFPKRTGEVFVQHVIADLDSDGHVEIVSITFDGRLYVWRMPRPTLDSQPWPQLRHGPTHLGVHPRNAIAIPTLSGLGAACMMILVAWGGIWVIRTRRSAIAERAD